MADEDNGFKLTPAMLEALRKEGHKDMIKATRWEPCLCGTLMDYTESVQKWHSGRFHDQKMVSPGINYTALLCGDCSKEFEDFSRIVCVGCRSLMGFFRPGQQATGFVFERKRHYHIVSCPRCDPKSTHTPVIEHEKFCKDNGIPTDTDKDLLQEIEQKTLQAEREAAKLRAEFETSKRKHEN